MVNLLTTLSYAYIKTRDKISEVITYGMGDTLVFMVAPKQEVVLNVAPNDWFCLSVCVI